MRGSISKHGKTYRVIYDVGTKSKRVQKTKGGFKSKKEAQEFLNKVLIDINEGTYKEPSKEPFSSFIHEWFEKSYKRSVEETTAETRWDSLKIHVIPYFGTIPINQITTRMLDDFYNDKLDEGLSPKTVREFHNLVRKAFSQAVKWSLLKNNPALDATPPKVPKRKFDPWTKEETKKFLNVAKENKNETIFESFVFTGGRRGEMLGLKWPDIDFENGKIRIVRSLARTRKRGLFLKDVKTPSSRRQISISPYLVEKLLNHKAMQETQKKMLGEHYNDQGMVFCTYDGNFKDPRNLLREFNRYIKKAGVPKITLHDLRHLHATLLMINGENPKVVSERLGHSDVGVTLDLYSHVTSDLQEGAANRFEDMFFKDSTENALVD
jgi:integrase